MKAVEWDSLCVSEEMLRGLATCETAYTDRNRLFKFSYYQFNEHILSQKQIGSADLTVYSLWVCPWFIFLPAASLPCWKLEWMSDEPKWHVADCIIVKQVHLYLFWISFFFFLKLLKWNKCNKQELVLGWTGFLMPHLWSFRFWFSRCLLPLWHSKRGLLSTRSLMKNVSGCIFCLVLPVIIASLSGVSVFGAFQKSCTAPNKAVNTYLKCNKLAAGSREQCKTR